MQTRSSKVERPNGRVCRWPSVFTLFWSLLPERKRQLAGHVQQADDEGELLLIDSHDCSVADAVWTLFAVIISQCGPVPTLVLVEWDHYLPDWAGLKAAAGRCASDHRSPRARFHAGKSA